MKCALLAATLLSTPSYAQGCMTRGEIVSFLADNEGENRRSVMLANGGDLVEIWANDETTTWTMTMTKPNGCALIVLFGDNFEARDDDLRGNL